MALPEDRELEALCDDIATLAARIRRQGPEVLRRARIGTRSIHRTSNLDTRVRGSRDSDPTSGPAIDAVDAPRTDPVRRFALQMVDELRSAARSLTIADSARANTAPPAPSPDTDPGDLWCVSCLRFEIHVPVVRAGRCDFCAAWRADHGLSDPPETAIRDQQRRGGRAAPRPEPDVPPAEPSAGRAVTAAQRLLRGSRRQ